jgi:hypothetical protein
VLFSALITTVSGDGDTALEVLLISLASLIVFWAAHAYAGTIATHGLKDGREVTLRAALSLSIAFPLDPFRNDGVLGRHAVGARARHPLPSTSPSFRNVRRGDGRKPGSMRRARDVGTLHVSMSSELYVKRT